VKNLYIASALALLLISATAANAATASSNASAEILTALTLTNTVPLEFGEIAASAAAGTVSVSTASVRTSTGGVTLAGLTPATASSFAVTGDAGDTYAITLPTSTTIASGANSMTVDTFTSAPDTTGTLSGGGTDTVLVGATLHVGANQVAGDYIGTFDLIVVYN
jgi:hypothetical protein